MASKDLTNPLQPELALVRQPESADIPEAIIYAQKSSSAALALSIQSSGLEDKEIYLPLGIDAGHWTRIRKGEAHFPLDKMAEFCATVGNKVLPMWIAYQVGCGMVMLKGEAELRAERLQKALDEEKIKVRVLTDAINGRAA